MPELEHLSNEYEELVQVLSPAPVSEHVCDVVRPRDVQHTNAVLDDGALRPDIFNVLVPSPAHTQHNGL